MQRSIVEHLLCAVGNPGGFATQHVVVVAIVGIVPIVIFATLVCWPLSSTLILWSSCTMGDSTNAILFRRVHKPLEVTMVNW